MRLQQVIFSQGFGTRHECDGLIIQGRVLVNGIKVDDPDAEVDVEALTFCVDGKEWQYCEKAVVALHKPAGYECSQKPIHHPSVMTLLPPPLRVRNVQPVGRLDEDTTGLLILTDDGALQHRLIHPKKHVAKVYYVTCKHPIEEKMLQKLTAGVVLDDSPKPVSAQAVEKIDETHFTMTLTQGKYHQVKRMVAAAGNRVEALHRTTFGRYSLPETLKEGDWCFIKKEDLI